MKIKQNAAILSIDLLLRSLFLLFVQRSIGAVIRCNCGFSNSVERHTKKKNRMRLIDKINYNTHTRTYTQNPKWKIKNIAIDLYTRSVHTI